MAHMHLLTLFSYFMGGVMLMNAVPHLVSGVSGRRFPSPFAKPPGKGLSSAPVNLVWGFANLAIAYLLVCRIGRFDLGDLEHAGAVGLGMLLIGLMLAWHFGRQNGGRGPDQA
jgi:hypothetical protein